MRTPGKNVIRLWKRTPVVDWLWGFGDGKAPEADGIDQLKDHGVCANAEGQQQDRNCGKYRRVAALVDRTVRRE